MFRQLIYSETENESELTLKDGANKIGLEVCGGTPYIVLRKVKASLSDLSLDANHIAIRT